MKKSLRWKLPAGRIKFRKLFIPIIFLLGLGLLLYPSVSNYWNSYHSSEAISRYAEEVSKLDPATCQELLDNAYEYNEKLFRSNGSVLMDTEQKERYDKELNISGDGVMGYIDIPALNVELPIYHGTAESVLQIAVGHLDWTSLPVGGVNTHAVLSGHRGLPSARLFTDLDQLQEGDFFELTVLNQMLTYEVDQIRIVEPDDVGDLGIVAGMDYCTLVTCTPYGINSHRLLVRGHRVENSQQTAMIVSDAVQIDEKLVAALLAVPLMLIIICLQPAYDRYLRRLEYDD